MTMKISKLTTLMASMLLVVATGAKAQNSYGGYDIIGTRGVSEQSYASVRGWNVVAAFVNGNFAYCAANNVRNDANVRVGYDGMQWQLTMPLPANHNWFGSLEVDGRDLGASGTVGQGQAIIWLGIRDLDALKRGNAADFGTGRTNYDFSLMGMTASTLKIEECVQRRGQAPRQSASGQSAGGAVLRATCATVFGGNFACSLTQQRQESGYRDVLTVIADDSMIERYLIKQIDDQQAEVWVSYPEQPQNWGYMGYWRRMHSDQDCIEPVPNQGRAVQDALGQDAWQLCIRL